VVRVDESKREKGRLGLGVVRGEWVQYGKKRRRGLEPGFFCV
jgi:hypothetical protein